MVPLAAMFISKFDDHMQRLTTTFTRLKTEQGIIKKDIIRRDIIRKDIIIRYYMDILDIFVYCLLGNCLFIIIIIIIIIPFDH